MSTTPLSPQWPVRSMKECDKLMTQPGAPWELNHTTIKGRPLRVYKNLPDSIRDLWKLSQQWNDRDYIVYEGERMTYRQAHKQSEGIAALLFTRGVRKGDRVAIVMRNYPEWITSFQAIHTLGAVSSAVNAWSPALTLLHCLLSSGSKVAIVDIERAKLLQPHLKELKDGGVRGLFVVRCVNGEVPSGWESLEECVEGTIGVRLEKTDIKPDDYATIFFTSGTTSMPKGVLATQRQFLTNYLNTSVGTVRAALRNGDGFPEPDLVNQKSILLSIPLFHVTGNLSFLTVMTATGGKMVLMHKWDIPAALALLKAEKITTAGGVPSMVMDLLASSLAAGEHSLQSVSFGGAPASIRLPSALRSKWPTVVGGTAYGLSETNAVLVSHGGEDYVRRPTSCGYPAPVCDVKILNPETLKEMPVGGTGEIYCRGPNIAEGYWGNEKATKEAFSPDGWFQTGDIGHIDHEGFLFISDRAKEIIIRGGENISSISVENAFYLDPRIKDAAVVPVPDEKLGELVGALIVLHPQFKNTMTEAELQALVAKTRPKHEVPVMIVLRDEVIRNANGKIVKKDIKTELGKIWEERTKGNKSLAKL